MISIDPGLNYCGVALWDEGLLRHAFTVHGNKEGTDADGWHYVSSGVAFALQERASWLPYKPRLLVYEMPQLLAQWREGDPNAILQIAGAAGMILRAICDYLPVEHPIVPVRPSEWTGSKKKGPNHRKMWRKVNEVEQMNLKTSFAQHCGDSAVNDAALAYLIQHGDVADFEHALDAVCVGLFHLGRFGKY